MSGPLQFWIDQQDEARLVGRIVPPIAGGLVKLFEQTLLAPAANIDTGANGIAAGHAHLVFQFVGGNDQAVLAQDCRMQFNGDAGANYDWCWVRNSSGAITAVSAHADTSVDFTQIPGTSIPAGFNAPCSGNLVAYDQTTLDKSGTCLGGCPGNAGAGERIIFASFVWRSTAAINQVKVFAAAGNLITGSRLTVYGSQ